METSTSKPITYTSAENHTYHVSEVKGLDPKVIYDTKIVDLNVRVVKTIGETLNTLSQQLNILKTQPC